MNYSLESKIEKIKLQETNVENTLKEKRIHENALSALNQAIKDEIFQAGNSEQELLAINDRIIKLRPLLEIEKIRRNALLAQLETYTNVFEDLKTQCNQGIANVWRLRSSLCVTVENVADGCDILPLLMRPVCVDRLSQTQTKAFPKHGENDGNLIDNENRLKTALQRRKDLEAKKEKLLTEPETGDEFVRIKNALLYSLEKIENLQHGIAK